MSTPIPLQCTTFYEQIKMCQNLDLRDERGKIHSLAFVLLGVMISLCRNRDGVLSSIHRSMVNTHQELCTHMQLAGLSVVSRAQLPLILKKLMLLFLANSLFHFSASNYQIIKRSGLPLMAKNYEEAF